MITQYLFDFFSSEMTGDGSYIEKLFFSIIMSWLLLMFLCPMIISGLISLIVAVPMAILEKNNLGFFYNYITDLSFAFFKMNDVVSLIFLLVLGVSYLYSKNKKMKPLTKKSSNKGSGYHRKKSKKKRK